MSRRAANGVRGPASALTSYLREQNINTGPMNMYRRRPVAETAAATAGEAEGDQATTESAGAGPSNHNAVAPPESETAKKRKRQRADGDEEVDSDNLDDDSDEEAQASAPAPVKKKGKAAEPKVMTARAKAAAKKKAKQDGTYKSDDEEDDAYKAPSKMLASSKPPIGSMEPCAKCEKKFAVTKYTQPASPPPGYLCHNCTKAAGIDPFKKPAAPKQKRKPEDKRKIVNFEEKDIVPSLALHCISVITKHIEDVEALGDISPQNMNEICKIISRNRKLTRDNAMLFYNVENTKLSLYDCTLLDPSALSSLATFNPNVRSLGLEYCGRMNDSVLSHWATQLSSLCSIDLLGPFNVRTEAWVSFIENVKQPLQRFAITQSPRFDLTCLEALLKRCGPNLIGLRLKEVSKMDDDWLKLIAGFTKLTSLDISRPKQSATDGAFVELIAAIGGNLTHLDISGHEELGDQALLRGVGRYCSKLVSLAAADLPLLTDEGIAVFFGAEPGPREVKGPADEEGDVEMRDANPDADTDPAQDVEMAEDSGNIVHEKPESQLPPLQTLDISRSPSLKSKALSALLQHSGPSLRSLNINQWKDASNDVLLRVGPSCPQLHTIDLGWCREVDNFVIKELLDGCPKLKLILCGGCNRLTGDCPRKSGVAIRGIEPGV